MTGLTMREFQAQEIAQAKATNDALDMLITKRRDAQRAREEEKVALGSLEVARQKFEVIKVLVSHREEYLRQVEDLRELAVEAEFQAAKNLMVALQAQH